MPITEIEHSAFCETEDDLPAKLLAEEMAVNVRRQPIPPEYLHYQQMNLTTGSAKHARNWAAQSPCWATTTNGNR